MPAVPDNEESRASCVCAACPSKPKDDMAFYCVTGKSPAEVERGFCACSWCPVWSCYGLAGSFYCDEGPVRDDEAAIERGAVPDDEAAIERGAVPDDGATADEDLTE